MSDLTAAIDAAARAWFDRSQAGRKDDGRLRPDGQPWTFDDLPPIDQHAFREVVLPVVLAAAPHIREAIAAEIDAFEPADPFMRHSADWKDALDWAADIARKGATP